ncbi:hypothetical protein ACR6C2_00345 [Streptomyces sp. INA 01156]
MAIPSLPEDNPAADLFGTLDRIRDLGAEIACPAHQFAYRDVAERAMELKAFHQREVEKVRGLLADHGTAWEIAPHLTWPKPWDELGRVPAGSRSSTPWHSCTARRAEHRAPRDVDRGSTPLADRLTSCERDGITGSCRHSPRR